MTDGTLQIVNANGLFNNNAGTAAVSISTSAGAVLELDSTNNYFPTSGSYIIAIPTNWALGTSGGLTIKGNGTLRFNGTGSGNFALDDQYLNVPVVMAMTGGELDIAGGTLMDGLWGSDNWTNNNASMNIAGGRDFPYGGGLPRRDH